MTVSLMYAGRLDEVRKLELRTSEQQAAAPEAVGRRYHSSGPPDTGIPPAVQRFSEEEMLAASEPELAKLQQHFQEKLLLKEMEHLRLLRLQRDVVRHKRLLAHPNARPCTRNPSEHVRLTGVVRALEEEVRFHVTILILACCSYCALSMLEWSHHAMPNSTNGHRS